MRNTNHEHLDLAPLDFDPEDKSDILALPTPIVIEGLSIALWESEVRAWADTVPAALA